VNTITGFAGFVKRLIGQNAFVFADMNEPLRRCLNQNDVARGFDYVANSSLGESYAAL
jgi:hypothetical protein